MNIGERIRQRRIELQMSQDELARRVGYKSRTSVNKIELNLQGLTLSKVRAFAVALNTTAEYLLGYETDKEKYLDYIREYFKVHSEGLEDTVGLISDCSKLDDCDRQAVLQAVRSMVEKMLQSEKY